MITVYTTLFEQDKALGLPYSQHCEYGHNVRWLALTNLDNVTVPEPWIAQKIDETGLHPTLERTRCKILSHRVLDNAGTVVWIDPAVILNCSPERLASYVDNDTPIAVGEFHADDCVYEAMHELAPNEKLQAQMDYYRHKRYPENAGLSDTAVLVRRQTNSVKWLEWSWWLQVQTFSGLAWTSFDYSVWELGMRDHVTDIPGTFVEGCMSRRFSIVEEASDGNSIAGSQA